MLGEHVLERLENYLSFFINYSMNESSVFRMAHPPLKMKVNLQVFHEHDS